MQPMIGGLKIFFAVEPPAILRQYSVGQKTRQIQNSIGSSSASIHREMASIVGVVGEWWGNRKVETKPLSAARTPFTSKTNQRAEILAPSRETAAVHNSQSYNANANANPTRNPIVQSKTAIVT